MGSPLGFGQRKGKGMGCLGWMAGWLALVAAAGAEGAGAARSRARMAPIRLFGARNGGAGGLRMAGGTRMAPRMRAAMEEGLDTTVVAKGMQGWEVEAKREVVFWRTRVKMYDRLIRSAQTEVEVLIRMKSDGEKRLKAFRRVDPLDSRPDSKACKVTLEAWTDEIERLQLEIGELEGRKGDAINFLHTKRKNLQDISSENIEDLSPLRPFAKEVGVPNIAFLNDLAPGSPASASEIVGISATESMKSEDLTALVRQTETVVADIEERLQETARMLKEAKDGEKKEEEKFTLLLAELGKLRVEDPLDKSPGTLRVVEEAEIAQATLAGKKAEVVKADARYKMAQTNLRYAKRQLRIEKSILERVLDQITHATVKAEAVAKAAENGDDKTDVRGTSILDKIKSPFLILAVLLSGAEYRKTSEKYIGWLKQTDQEPVLNKTERFGDILLDTQSRIKVEGKEGLLSQIRDDAAYVFVPGFLWQIYPAYFDSTVKAFQQRGMQASLCTQVGGASGTYENAAAIRREILDAHAKTNKPVVLITHSKGGIDSAAALSLYRDELVPVVRGIVFCQCPYGGAPLATDLTADPVHYTLAHWMRKYVRGSWQVVHDMKYENRMKFLERNPLPPELAAVSFHSTTKSITSIQQILTTYVKKRYGTDNDGLVIPADAEIPGSSVVRYDKELDHVGTVWPTDRRNEMPDEDKGMLENLLLQADTALGKTSYVNPSIRTPTRYARSVGWAMVAADRLLRKISKNQPTRKNDVPTAPELFSTLVQLLQEDPRYSRNL
mmetsp:Transcript_9664/g.14476  ORF Transcript_9664/g.14476 Transcript_9664/m.14476 type:complete len:782 (+) Transcript_9664:63-2408(+)|eukprot:CAMPEP_0167768682 /NCGR_PEP_ID=MMETSP0110_2-20121227/16823_1 /TAXON_ID=629695 /ORGANISM="Gymnochlora sp., Strain CCMP2014" /LENGTH=781 /DNA_ID=CAMNT_0007657423 /DNA_START=96 /DNA_END=2441 /DNA_ORIENTATION=+